MRFIWDFIRYVIYLCLLLLLGAGLYAGNTAYNQLFSAPWDKILGMENHRDDLDQVHRAEGILEEGDGAAFHLVGKSVAV